MIRYLKATDRAALLAALGDLWDSEREQFHGPNPADALVDIGTIYQGTGQFVEVEGVQVEQQETIPGYHANIMLHGEIPKDIEDISIVPEKPRFVFAGHE